MQEAMPPTMPARGLRQAWEGANAVDRPPSRLECITADYRDAGGVLLELAAGIQAELDRITGPGPTPPGGLSNGKSAEPVAALDRLGTPLLSIRLAAEVLREQLARLRGL